MSSSNPSITVSNSSPLIALADVGRLDLLETLFTTVFIPPAVALEISPTVVVPAWIQTKRLARAVPTHVHRTGLGNGETEAISLALELQAARLILDDRDARSTASSLNIPIIGVLGILLAAKRRGALSAIRPVLDELGRHGFFCAPELERKVLVSAGE